MNRWNPIEWSMALDGLDAQGVDVLALTSRWEVPGADRDEVVTSRGAVKMTSPVILTAERHAWILGVLAGEVEPRPIPE